MAGVVVRSCVKGCGGSLWLNTSSQPRREGAPAAWACWAAFQIDRPRLSATLSGLISCRCVIAGSIEFKVIAQELIECDVKHGSESYRFNCCANESNVGAIHIHFGGDFSSDQRDTTTVG